MMGASRAEEVCHAFSPQVFLLKVSHQRRKYSVNPSLN